MKFLLKTLIVFIIGFTWASRKNKAE